MGKHDKERIPERESLMQEINSISPDNFSQEKLVSILTKLVMLSEARIDGVNKIIESISYRQNEVTKTYIKEIHKLSEVRDRLEVDLRTALGNIKDLTLANTEQSHTINKQFDTIQQLNKEMAELIKTVQVVAMNKATQSVNYNRGTE